jgi:hypothetical protein
MTTTDPKEVLSKAKAAKAEAERQIAEAEKAARTAAAEEVLELEMDLRRKQKTLADFVTVQNVEILAIKKKIADLKIFTGEDEIEAETTPVSKTSKLPEKAVEEDVEEVEELEIPWWVAPIALCAIFFSVWYIFF